ncbi:PREDICTED: CCR4-NOT transcription complex subunit 10 [Nicrophorus vespilloides]|uniref:CCR4-NOT transcription complex subunit 10 n=1 Tax=Nicrophorus vespilloides TaxID=110193 RepID=A0ABM1NEI1_NICVS|nr:PREDICTED: CCR4-NOT transcription complex subunit 10 [Nicrophorus vespilloides]
MSNKEEFEKTIVPISEQDRDLARNALEEFKQKNYAACLQNINKLDMGQDFKVLHNKYVAEYHKSDLKKTDQFQRNMNNLLNQFQLVPDKLDDIDHCVAYYNLAVLAYHQKHYSYALQIMDKVYKFIEPMDEALSRQVGLLLVELHLCVKLVDKASNLITYLHNHAVNEKPIEKEKKPLSKGTETYLKCLDMYRIKCNILKHSTASVGSDLQLLYQNQKGNVEVVFLMANKAYLEGSFQVAMNLLESMPKDSIKLTSGESSIIMYYNNMGIIHHAMGKPNMACHFYQQAIKEEIYTNSKLKGETTLFVNGSSKYHELMYNLGISMLHAGKAAQAFECFIIAVKRYHRNSRLWLRIAECCIQVHKESNAIDFDMYKKHRDLVIQIVGSKENQKIVLTTNITTDKKFSSESQSYAVPIATLEFASLCLRNAKTLLPSSENSSPVPLLLSPGVSPQLTSNPGPSPSSPLNLKSIDELRNAILAASSYVSICLGDYIVALEHSKELLSQPKLSGAHRMLAHLYAAESLVLLDKLSDALDHLNPENLRDISLDMDQSAEECAIKSSPPAKWFPNTLNGAMAVMHYNIAVVKTIRGQFDQAQALLKQIWQNRNNESRVPAHIVMLVLYIELQLGHVDVARTIIKQYSLQQKVN